MELRKRLNSLKVLPVGVLAAVLLAHANPAAAYTQVVDGTITQQVTGVVQNTESAIVAVKSGNIYARNDNDALVGNIVGHYTAGEKLCMISSTTGPGGTIVLSYDNPGIPMDAVVANDGSFIPDTVPGNCITVATAVDLEAQQAQAHAETMSDLASAIGPITALLFTFLAGVLLCCFSYPLTFGNLERHLSEEEAAQQYPGFSAGNGEIGYKGGSLYRLNTTGTLVHLSSRWRFDNKTGEFQRVTGRMGMSTVVSQQSHQQRFNYFYQRVTQARVAQWGFAVVGLTCGIYSLKWWNPSGIAIPADYYGLCAIIIFLGMPGAFFLPLAAWPKSGLEARFAGPEPLTREYDDFGPTSATAPAYHPAQDDLGYKPPT